MIRKQIDPAVRRVRILRTLAIIVAFASVYFFFLKLLFF